MKRTLIIVLTIALLASCATKQKGFSEAEYKGSCGGDSNVSGWRYVNFLPEYSIEIRKLVEANAILENGKQNFAVESWFMNNKSEVMVCRTSQSPKDSCTGDWWSFSKQGQEWKLVEKSGWLCFSDLKKM